MRRNGFSVIELLIAVLIIGIIAAIAMGNYFNAVHRAKQKKTMADMRTTAVAWEARAVDVRQYNAAGAFTMLPASVTYPQMVTMLIPTYVRDMSRTDGWGFPLEFTIDQAIGSGTGAAGYAIRSPARDGQTEGNAYPGGPTTDYDCDIVYASGQFIAWPEGVQQR
jgi:prepilin-type N-terminal cleavage/methylation domain-containing protein